MGRYKKAVKVVKEMRLQQHEDFLREFYILADQADLYIEEGGAADRMEAQDITPQEATAWAKKRENARNKFIYLAETRFDDTVGRLFPTVPLPARASTSSGHHEDVAHDSVEWTTVVQLTAGGFAEIRCPDCKGNAVIDRRTKKLRFIKGVEGMKNHMGLTHGLKLKGEAAEERMSFRLLSLDDVRALNEHSPSAPKIEMKPCKLPSETGDPSSKLAPVSAVDMESFGQSFENLNRSPPIGARAPRKTATKQTTKAPPPKRAKAGFEWNDEDAIGSDTEGDRMWLARELDMLRDIAISVVEEKPRPMYL